MNRRDFMRDLAGCSVAAGALVLGRPAGAAQGKPAPKPETNLDAFMGVPRGPHALPGPFPGKVVQVSDPRSLVDDRPDPQVIAGMFDRGITSLTGQGMKKSFDLLFAKDDVVGIKVNPVGAPLISTRVEVVEALTKWLIDCGLPRKNIVIWDRFEQGMAEAGFTPERFEGMRIEALQIMAEEGGSWKDKTGLHVSRDKFDPEMSYFAKGIVGKQVPGYKDDDSYQNQHVFVGEHSYFGKLVTQELTKIVNVPVFKNTGHGISMATKNLGYGAVCNTGRLHHPLFFRVCTEVLAAPCIRDKLVLNVLDGLRGQYDGGPMKNAQFVYPHHSLYFATDPFALDTCCHHQLVQKRKQEGIQVDEHPRYTDYLHQAQELGLGIADREKIQHVRIAT